MVSKERIPEMLDLLKEEYPDAFCGLDHENVFQLLISTILSAQTTDKSVNRIAPALYGAYPDAFALGAADPAEVAEYIRTIGMYKTKSKNIVGAAKQLAEEFGGEVPQDRAALESLPGVGRKTANVVLADGFGEQHIAVDTHVFRLANRIGLAQAKNVRDTEKALMEILPNDRWTEAHHLLITHGRRCCGARKPECGRCVIRQICERNGVDVRASL